jgi:biotin carboxyl carrier protein
MHLNATRLTFALILILGGSKAEKSLKTHLPEDALFWAHRELDDGSMPPAPTEPAPSEPAPTEPAPSEPAPTEPAPTEPAPTAPVSAPTPGTAPACGLEVNFS